MPKFAAKKVIDHFKESELYRVRKGIVHPEEDPIMLDFIYRYASKGDRILEVGGGSGAFLDLVLENSNMKDSCNLELAFSSYKNQANKSICLMGGDALNLPFKESSFDWVVIKNLLHHLVGRTRGESKKNAKKAVEELIRVLKDGGYVIILDQYNKNTYFSSFLFYLTMVFSIFGVSLGYFGLGKNVIVSFLTPDETISNLISGGNVNLILNIQHPINLPKRFKLTLLMSNIGRVVLIGQIEKPMMNSANRARGSTPYHG
jgi:SAM-dependent methyltransferase